ncbi:MAG: hypothetical protein H0T72_10560, partial [Chloroflexia bacterium]|nr:hypothetical protein [Chloroflexia bacterium]
LTAVTDLVVGPDGMLYAAEMSTGNTEEPPFLTPNSGRIVRMTGPDSLEEVVIGIDAPAYFAFGSDDALYLTAPAFAPDAGVGHGDLLRIDLSSGIPVSLAGMATPVASCAAGTPAA